ncbi:MAG: extracellular solute-binding protein [Candidatus Azambacteria bacterium]|nr:extracellular solute-binding protein [Candidatus Azambacteria bacterium]
MIIFGREISRGQLTIFGAVFIIVVLLILGFIFGSKPPAQQRTTLEFWGLYDDGYSVWQSFFDAYRKDGNSNIFINYTKMNPDTYEQDLIEALASGKAPDIIMFHSSWLAKHGNKISPLPDNLMTLKQFQETFPDVAVTNFVAKSQIYALPVWTDVLTMFYNKDLFNTAGIATPPKTWNEFIKIIQKLSVKDKLGNLTKSGAALGTADNVNHATDILSLLMLQIGAKMISDNGEEATFDQGITVNDNLFLPGESALRFYTDFANPKSSGYAWNDRMPNSLEAFITGKTAIIFDYAVNVPEIKKRAPNLRLGMATTPQPAGASRDVNYVSYWGYSVPLASKNPLAVWQFLLYLTRKDINQAFSNATLRPASRRDVISEEQTSTDLGVFAEEVLSATNWYQVDPAAIEKIFKDMINAVVLESGKPADAIRDAASKVTFLMRK